MPNPSGLLIAVDAGHGGYDPGAVFGGRVEKDDNLRLAQAVQRGLEERGAEVLLTRITDVFVSLEDRVDLANRLNANLFLSLHRNSYIQQTPLTAGAEILIHNAAEEETARAASLVLEEVISAGVQRSAGVDRGDHYVLRNTRMPAMQLEMGYIINAEDNRLFDERLEDYGEAIARGILRCFGVPAEEADAAADVSEPASPAGSGRVRAGQSALNARFGSGIRLTGVFDPDTRRAAVRVLQETLNGSYGAGLAADGIWGPRTAAAVPPVGEGGGEELVCLLQSLLLLRGYDPGGADGVFGPRTRSALYAFQRDNSLMAEPSAGPAVFAAMLG